MAGNGAEKFSQFCAFISFACSTLSGQIHCRRWVLFFFNSKSLEYIVCNEHEEQDVDVKQCLFISILAWLALLSFPFESGALAVCMQKRLSFFSSNCVLSIFHYIWNFVCTSKKIVISFNTCRQSVCQMEPKKVNLCLLFSSHFQLCWCLCSFECFLVINIPSPKCLLCMKSSYSKCAESIVLFFLKFENFSTETPYSEIVSFNTCTCWFNSANAMSFF